jgi:hypothetical protein
MASNKGCAVLSQDCRPLPQVHQPTPSTRPEETFPVLSWRELIVAGGFALGWLLYLTPSLSYFISDPDGGLFICGAWQLLKTGAQPQADILCSYGPMSFYVRAVAQLCFGQRLIAEVVLVCVAYAFAYTLLFALTRRLSGSRGTAFFLLSAALVCIPRYYKFFVVLMPMLTLTAGISQILRPTRTTAFLLGAIVGTTALFRHDFGIYCLIAAGVALSAGVTTGTSARLSASFSFAAGIGAVAGPWVLGVIGLGRLPDFIRDLAAVTRTQESGLSLPHPLLTWIDPWGSALFLGFYLVPFLLAFVVLALRRRLARNEKAVAGFVAALATLTLLQSTHRADLGHLLQSIPAGFAALALLWMLYARVGARRWVCLSLRAGTLAMTFLPAAMLAISNRWIPIRSPATVVECFQDARLDRIAIRGRLAKSDPPSPLNEAILTAARLTRPDQRIVVFPFSPQVAYFADRLMAGDTLLVAPGYFDLPQFQERIIAGLKRDRPALVLWDVRAAFDGRPERNSTVSHASVYRYVTEHFRQIDPAGPFSVLVQETVSDSAPHAN